MKRNEYRSTVSYPDRSARPNILIERSGEGDPSTRQNLLKMRSISTLEDFHTHSSSNLSRETPTKGIRK